MEVPNVTLEICVESVEGALAAQEGGADRIELCAALSEGGITPSIGLVEETLRRCALPIMVMIRPRGGSFVYTDAEFEVMLTDARKMRDLGVEGVVAGILSEDGSVDVERSKKLAETAYPLSCTFHRAIDVAIDPFKSLEDIIACGFDRVLTSGQAIGAADGAPVIRELVERAKGRIAIMAGAGVRPENVAALISDSGVSEVHSSASVWIEDYRSTPARDALGRQVTAVELVRGLRSRIAKADD